MSHVIWCAGAMASEEWQHMYGCFVRQLEQISIALIHQQQAEPFAYASNMRHA